MTGDDPHLPVSAGPRPYGAGLMCSGGWNLHRLAGLASKYFKLEFLVFFVFVAVFIKPFLFEPVIFLDFLS